MNSQIILVLILNFIISLIGTLAYSVRLVGVRTGKIAVSFAELSSLFRRKGLCLKFLFIASQNLVCVI